MPSFAGLSVNTAFPVAVHGPSHASRGATRPAHRLRHARTPLGAAASSAAIAGSDPLGTNARSFATPSPFTSPPTMGANGAPDATRAHSDAEKTSPARTVTVPVNVCRTSSALRPHSTAH